ncbi:DUF1461 domain-containing protein, partial [Candidatus Woesearchaeota archaeon]|nr:DUF1461 domain-containing protein [Candidatus Woesearchaeota archaeon]
MNLRKIPLAAFLIPVCLLLFSFRLVVFDEGFYKSEFEKYDVYDDVEKESADSALKSLVDYMKDGKPLSDFFNEKEKAHMVDVRNIIQKLLLVFYITLLILIVLFLTRGKALRSLFYGGVFTLALLLIFFISSYAW